MADTDPAMVKLAEALSEVLARPAATPAAAPAAPAAEAAPVAPEIPAAALVPAPVAAAQPQPPPGKAPLRNMDEFEALPQSERLARMDEADELFLKGEQ
jgi:hypothetical protein